MTSPEAAGTVMWRFGAATTTADSLDITFHGRGGHGAMPERTIDPVVMAARFIEDVQTVISREKDPAAFGVVTIGAMEAGSAAQYHSRSGPFCMAPSEPWMTACAAKMLDGIRRTANGVAAIAGAPPPKIEMSLDRSCRL